MCNRPLFSLATCIICASVAFLSVHLKPQFCIMTQAAKTLGSTSPGKKLYITPLVWLLALQLLLLSTRHQALHYLSHFPKGKGLVPSQLQA